MIFYNENDPAAVAWLYNLVRDGHLPHGPIDCRDVRELNPEHFNQIHQAHFFAGIGGWPLALTIADYRDACWTASLPCQPFSKAGKQLGESDERHLWPVFKSLIEICKPPTIFGEQVASTLGKVWFSRVRADLEALGYAVGCADLSAAGVDSPHVRHRLFWVAHSDSLRLEGGSSKLRTKAPLPKLNLPASFGSHQASAVCKDGRARRFESVDGALAYGIPKELGYGQPRLQGLVRAARQNRGLRLRCYGNAIVPLLAAEFVAAFVETTK